MKALRHWYSAIGMTLLALVCLVLYSRDGNWAASVIACLPLLAVAWFVSPLLGGTGHPWHALRDADAGRHPVVIFWRPGCLYCLRMRLMLGAAGNRAEWVNIWRDDGGRAFVREHNSGNETVPTVILAGEVLTNPSPGRVRRQLAHA